MQQGLLGTSLSDRASHLVAERKNIVGYVVRQIGVLGTVPNLLHRIEIGRVGGQPLDLDTLRETPQHSMSARASARPGRGSLGLGSLGLTCCFPFLWHQLTEVRLAKWIVTGGPSLQVRGLNLIVIASEAFVQSQPTGLSAAGMRLLIGFSSGWTYRPNASGLTAE